MVGGITNVNIEMLSSDMEPIFRQKLIHKMTWKQILFDWAKMKEGENN